MQRHAGVMSNNSKKKIRTHVDKGKWLELDPGAQRNIAYRT